MILYSSRPGHRAGQIAADLFIVLWVSGWVLAGRTVTALVSALAVPAYSLQSAGAAAEQRLSAISARVAEVPVVGQRLSEAFAAASGSGGGVTSSAQELAAGIERLGVLLGLTTAGTPIVMAVLPWLVTRGRFISRAVSARQLVRSGGGMSLFALRALTRHRPAELLRVHPDPAAAWRAGDPEAISALARMYLRDAGVLARDVPGADTPGGTGPA